MKTKYVIGDKVYDIEKSKLILKATLSNTVNIYKTKKGNYFGVSPLYENFAFAIPEEGIKKYLKTHDYDKYAELFGELEEA